MAVAMSLGMVFGGCLALSDRAASAEVAEPPAVAINLPAPDSELLPPQAARNHWNDLASGSTLS